MSQFLAIVVTALLTFVLTVLVGAIFLAYFGIEQVGKEVSPFVQDTQKRIADTVAPSSERTQPKTEADLIMDAVAGTQGASVLIYREDGASEETFVARGLLVSTDGIIVTDTEALLLDASYTVAIPGVKDRFPVQKSAQYSDALTILSITHSTALLPKFSDVQVESEQLVVAVTGDKNQRIATGIVTETLEESIRTNLVGTITPGSVLVSKEGFVVGISTVFAQGAGQIAFTPLTRSGISDLRAFLDVEDTEI